MYRTNKTLASPDAIRPAFDTSASPAFFLKNRLNALSNKLRRFSFASFCLVPTVILFAAALTFVGPAGRHVVHAQGDDTGEVLFRTKVRRILCSQCLRCHNESKAKGGLRLDSRDALLQGGKSGPAIVPGEPDNSLLVMAIEQTTDLKMPRGEDADKLKPEEIQAIEDWIQAGAPWPREH